MKKLYIALGAVAVVGAIALLIAFDGGSLLHATAGHSGLFTASAAAAAVTVDDLAKLNTELGKISDQVKNFAEDIKAKYDAGQTVTTELKEKADKALSEQAEMRGRLQEIEQIVARRASPDKPASAKTPGELFIENEKVKAFCAEKSSRGRVRVDMATITSASNSAGALVEPMRIPGIVSLPERRLTVRDLLTPGRTGQNAVQFVQETGFTNNARVQSEGTLKGESNIAFELVTKSVSTVAHFLVASKQILDDAPMLQSHIDGRLRYGLAYKEEDQLLNGDGTGVNLHGILPQATAYSPAFSPVGGTMIDTMRLAILQSELAEFPATGIVLNPIDWTRIELTKDEEGRYIFANPQNVAGPMLWSRPVVATQAMDPDDFLTGAFRLGAQVFDREDANVEISTEDSDNFRKNLVTIRAEERLVLAVYRPEAFVYGDFGNISG
jgi:HK97 family phage major capsid protein